MPSFSPAEHERFGVGPWCFRPLMLRKCRTPRRWEGRSPSGPHTPDMSIRSIPKRGGTPLYSTILLLSSALGAGGDVVPAGGWGLGPRDAAGCQGAPTPPPPACCDTPAPSLLDRMRAKWAAQQQCCPPASQAPSAPSQVAPAPAATPCCDPCAQRPGLLDRIRARLAARKHKDCCQPCPSGCAPASEQKPPAGSTPPKEMPKPKEKVETPPAIAIPVPPPANSPGGTPY